MGCVVYTGVSRLGGWSVVEMLSLELLQQFPSHLNETCYT